MCAGFLTPTEGETLKGIGTRLSLVDRSPTAAALQELMVALKQPSPSGSIEAVAYSLASDPLELARALEDVIPLSGQEGAVVARLRPANLLFHWEDKTRSPANRGSAIGALASLSLSRDAAQKMRALAAALVEDHLEGLAERARSVGYYREAKAIAQDERGDPLLLIYLEMVDLHVHKRIMAYPDTEFTRWWGPRFQEIVRGNPMARPADPVIRYTRLDQRSMNETPAGPT
jgi:hypothetical protein